MSYRPVDPLSDLAAIASAVERLEQAAPLYGYSVNPSYTKVMRYIQQHQRLGLAFIVDEAYLLLVGHAEPWHSDDAALEERLVLKLHEGNILKVPEALEAIAKSSGYSAVLASDSSLNLRIGKLYERAGFRPITTTYYKDI